MFLAKSFTVPVEPVQKSDVVVTDRPFIPPVQKTPGAIGQMKATQPVDGPGPCTATRPVEAPCALIATQLVETPGATTVMQPTGQDVSDQFAADRPEVQPSIQLARLCPVPVVGERYSPQILLANLLLLRRTGSPLSPVLLLLEMHRTHMVNVLVTMPHLLT